MERESLISGGNVPIILKYLRTRIAFAVVSIFTLFSFMLVVSGSYFNWVLTKNEAEQKLTNLVKTQAKALDIEFTKQKTLAEEVYNFVRVTFDVDELELDPDYLDPANKDWFSVPMETRRPVWTDPYQTTIFEDKSIYWISYSIPVFLNDVFIGVTGHDVFFTDFRDKIVSLAVSGKGYGVLVNQEGEFLIHPQFPPLTKFSGIGDGKYIWIMDYLLEHQDGILRYTWLDDVTKIMAFSRLANGWVLMMTANEGEVFQDLYRHLRFSFLLTGIGILAAAFLILKITGNLTKSLEDVSSIISVTGQGDYETPLPTAYLMDESEIGILARSVEGMRVNLKNSFEKISKYNDTLEQLVEERTAELKDKQERLVRSLAVLKETQARLMESRKFEGIHRFLMEVAHRLNTPLGNAGLTLSSLVDLQESGACGLYSYPVLIKNVFFLLMKYSLQSPRKGDCPSVLSIHVFPKETNIVVVYRDSSPTSYDSVKNRIFEPYGTSSFKNDTGGMDLYLVYNIVTLGLKGEVEFLPEEDGTAYFRLTFPDIPLNAS